MWLFLFRPTIRLGCGNYCIYETDTIFFENGETTANVDDIVETVNHFSCFDYMLDFEDDHKFFYYRGLAEYPRVKEYLKDTCLSAQDSYKKIIDYFMPGKKDDQQL
jgi:hypothetical protein